MILDDFTHFLIVHSGLIGSPINGLVLDRWGFKGLSLFSGLALLIGASVIGVARSKLDTKLLAKA